MNTQMNEYLSDEELNILIEDTEKNAIFTAPPELALNVLHKIKEYEKKESEVISVRTQAITKDIRESALIEFRRFRLRVIAAVAAAVLIIFTAPELMPRVSETYVGKLTLKTTADKASTGRGMQRSMEIPSKAEVIGNDEIPTKDEILHRNGITQSIRNSHLISERYDRNNS